MILEKLYSSDYLDGLTCKIFWHVSELELGRDVIIAKGVSSEFGGISVQTKELFVIDPYED